MTGRLLLLALVVPELAWGSPSAWPPAESKDAPRLTLRAGERYFREDGRAVFVLGRNPAAMTPAGYDEHFLHAAEAGEQFVRIHFTYMPPGEKPGEIDAGMLAAWDGILDAAEKRGLAVLPVLGVWADWNDGSKGEAWHRWDANPYNAEKGGPAKSPGELLDCNECRRLWLKRLETFVKRWAGRRAIVGWEIFSELDLVSGTEEDRATRFVEAAAAVIRAADPLKRPVTASQAGVDEWPKLLRSPALDFVEIHPYADGAQGGRLDDLIVSTVRQRLRAYGKPVLIGESGLSAAAPRGTLDVAPRAEVGIRHAIWAAIVSGAMNGRALWWQDGYDVFEKVDLCSRYHQAAATAAQFVRGIDFAGFAPIDCTLPDTLKGEAIGNERSRLAWLRDARCEPPDWPVQRLTGQVVIIHAPGGAWHVAFVDPATGKSIGERRVEAMEGRLRVELPAFEDAIALRLTRQ